MDLHIASELVTVSAKVKVGDVVLWDQKTYEVTRVNKADGMAVAHNRDNWRETLVMWILKAKR